MNAPANTGGITRVLYTAQATVEGGRNGHGRSSDGQLEVNLAVPRSMGGASGDGANPEQLFAVGYAACFQSAVLNVAHGRGLDLDRSRIDSTVAIGPTGHGGLSLAVTLDLHADNLSRDDAASVLARADQLCPYSKATRGNIDVTLKFEGEPI